jgi:hypothetical protein
MTWTRLSDNFTDEPEFLRLSRDARLFHIEALVYCNRMLTNGRIGLAAVTRITDTKNINSVINELVNADMWWPLSDGDFQLNWSDQENADKVNARRAERKATQKRYRERVSERVSRHNSGDHSLCDARYCKAGEK